MLQAICNTSPVLFLYRIDAIGLLAQLFDEVWITQASVDELEIAKSKGYNIPDVADYSWLQIVNPEHFPSEWFALELGKGEVAAMSLGLEHPERVVILDDALARRVAHGAGLQV